MSIYIYSNNYFVFSRWKNTTERNEENWKKTATISERKEKIREFQILLLSKRRFWEKQQEEDWRWIFIYKICSVPGHLLWKSNTTMTCNRICLVPTKIWFQTYIGVDQWLFFSWRKKKNVRKKHEKKWSNKDENSNCLEICKVFRKMRWNVNENLRERFVWSQTINNLDQTKTPDLNLNFLQVATLQKMEAADPVGLNENSRRAYYKEFKKVNFK